MDKPTEGKPNSTENKKPSQGGNFVWYLIGLGLLLMVIMTFAEQQSSVVLDWSDFERLAEASNPDDPNQTGNIKVVKQTDGEEREMKLSKLSNVVIGRELISGKVDRLVTPTAEEAAEATEAPKAETVAFSVNWNDGMPKPGAMLKNYNIKYKGASGPNPLLEWIPTLLMMGLLIGLMVFMFRRIGGAGSPMAFGRSRGKLYAQDDLEVSFDDVAGIEEAVDELREVVDFLKNPERYQRLGGRIPKGVMLVGPPGTGKTLLSKAVAGEAGVPFFSLSGSDFVEMFVGVGAARVRDMFQQAVQRAPCIIFIDELDALGKTRGNGAMGSHDEREQTLNALLVEMDGFSSNSGVIVMAATNRPETLDPALMRPGRFDRHVLVDRPDVTGREQILKVHLENIEVDEDEVDIKALAGITSGFVGADLANMVNEAALLAARSDKKKVGNEEFYEAVERASIGLEKKSRVILDEEKERLAVHEAGHALVAYSLPNTDPVHKVSIIPRGLSALGYMQQRPEHDRYMITKMQLESRIQVMLGGTLAEELILEDIGSGASNDLDRATEVARSMVMDYGMSRLGRVTYRERTTNFLSEGGMPTQHHSEQTAREIDQEVKRIMEEALEQTKRILATRRSALEAITADLLKHEVIDAERLTELIDHSSPEPKLVPGTNNERKPETPAAEESSGEAAEG